MAGSLLVFGIVFMIVTRKTGDEKERGSKGARWTLSLIHISEPTRPLYISYAVFCLKKKTCNTIRCGKMVRATKATRTTW